MLHRGVGGERMSESLGGRNWRLARAASPGPGAAHKKRRLADKRAELPPVTSSQWERQGSPSRQRSPGSQRLQLQREAMTREAKWPEGTGQGPRGGCSRCMAQRQPSLGAGHCLSQAPSESRGLFGDYQHFASNHCSQGMSPAAQIEILTQRGV